jgi:hypothetical protein
MRPGLSAEDEEGGAFCGRAQARHGADPCVRPERHIGLEHVELERLVLLPDQHGVFPKPGARCRKRERSFEGQLRELDQHAGAAFPSLPRYPLVNGPFEEGFAIASRACC